MCKIDVKYILIHITFIITGLLLIASKTLSTLQAIGFLFIGIPTCLMPLKIQKTIEEDLYIEYSDKNNNFKMDTGIPVNISKTKKKVNVADGTLFIINNTSCKWRKYKNELLELDRKELEFLNKEAGTDFQNTCKHDKGEDTIGCYYSKCPLKNKKKIEDK